MNFFGILLLHLLDTSINITVATVVGVAAGGVLLVMLLLLVVAVVWVKKISLAHSSRLVSSRLATLTHSTSDQQQQHPHHHSTYINPTNRITSIAIMMQGKKLTLLLRLPLLRFQKQQQRQVVVLRLIQR